MYCMQGCQLSCIERETRAFHPISPESHAYIYIFFLLVRGLWCTCTCTKVPPTMCLLCENGCQHFRGLWCTCTCTKVPPTMCLLCENGCQHFWGKKKKWWSPPPPHQLFWDLRDIYRLRADGPRISHAEPSSKVGSPAVCTMRIRIKGEVQ